MKNFFKYVLATIIGILGFFMLIGVIFFLFSAVISIFTPKEKGLPSEGILELNFNSPIYENAQEKDVSVFNFNNKPDGTVYFRQIIDAILKAKDDDKIKGISLNLFGVNGGITQADDIREAILEFKKSGKFVYAYGVNMSQKAYYLATTADSIFLNPLGGVELKGMAYEGVFFKNLGEKYGIDFQVIRHGKYKSAVEPFMRTDFSEENKLQLSEMIGGIWKNISTDMATSRKIPIEQFNVDTDSLYGLVTDTAIQYKLVDGTMQESEYYEFLKKKLDVDEDTERDFYMVQLSDYATHLKGTIYTDKVAILYAAGQITEVENDQGIASETYKKVIKKLQDNDKIKAVVLRVNSGGGSAIASDEILYELKKLNEIKPVVVSFGDVAASGGYYIAMAGRKIYAEPNTITGSIGVLGMLPSVEKLTNRWGITTDYVTTNSNSVFYSPLTMLSPGSKHSLVQSVEHTYNRFVKVVSENRKMSTSQVDSLGQGRVWTGQEAFNNGLVDELGSLNDAIQYAVELADLEKYSISNFPEPKDEFEQLIKSFEQMQSSESILQENLSKEEYEIYHQIKQLKNQHGVMMYIPVKLEF